MALDSLLCAACGGRVVEAGCATCRSSLAQLREGTALPVGPLLAVAVALAVLARLAG